MAAEPAPGRPGLLALNPDERMKRHSSLPFANRNTKILELIENKGRDHTLIATKCDFAQKAQNALAAAVFRAS